MISPKHLDLFDAGFLQSTIERRMAGINMPDIRDYLQMAKADPEELHALINDLHIRYSEFFRNPLTFASLEKIILPQIIRKHHYNEPGEIRIWSSACAGGQEPFSIAMLMEELLASEQKSITYRIFASDIETIESNQQAEGLFHDGSLNNVPYRFISRWFKRTGNVYRIDPYLRSRIVFTTFDLTDDSILCPPDCIYGDFDLILCCNVLFYYNMKTRNKIIRKLSRCLVPGGYLVTGETERDLVARTLFREEFPNSAIFSKTDGV